MEKKIAIVTGGSSGIGRATAAALARAGCLVYEFSRREIPQEGVRHLSVDVTREEAVQDAVNQILSEEGRIDIVVNCAGFGISGAVEFTEPEAAKGQFDVNFFGCVTVNRAVLPILRRQGGGRILLISSVAASAHIPFQAYYSASKAALESYACALANEVRPFGIAVTAVALGTLPPALPRPGRSPLQETMYTAAESEEALRAWSGTRKRECPRSLWAGKLPKSP